MATFDPTGISSIPAGFAGSAVISSDQPLGLTEITSYDGTPTHTSNADSYSIPSTTTSDTRIPLPQVLFAAGYQSVVHVQNVAPLSSTIQLMLETSFTSTRNNVPANAAVRFDRNSMGVGYNGSGMLTSGSAINALVDIEAAALPPPATATATATVTATAAVTVTAVPATQVPTPTLPASPGVTPTLYLNYLTGAPGSSFLISGYNFPPTSSVALQINSVLAVSLTTDANGSFRLLLNAPSNALPGFYVVTAVVVSAPAGVTLAQVHAPTGKIGVFELVTSGPNAVVRTAPANAPATSANIPATAAANPLTSPPYTYLPLVRK
jgi:hypothetical protein